MADALLIDTTEGETLRLAAAGAWTSINARPLELAIDATARRHASVMQVAIDMGAGERLDTFGAWLLERLVRAFQSGGAAIEIIGLKQDYRALMDELHQIKLEAPPRRRAVDVLGALAAVGRTISNVGDTFVGILNMLGAICVSFGRVIVHPRRLRFTSLVH